jgi:phospho-N-acetylmuramoyl-pentapeptide-transferase
MLYHLLYPLHTVISSFNVFRYITFRTIYAAITALVICFVVGPWLIRKLRSLDVGQQVRDDGPSTHQVKQGTPTMGGISSSSPSSCRPSCGPTCGWTTSGW